MGVKPGYKQTEVGILPDDWHTERVRNLASIRTGAKNTQDRRQDGAYPFFVRSSTVERINSFSFDGEAVLTAGDGVGTGKVFHYIRGPFDFHQRVYKISDFTSQLNGYFFYLYFSTHFYDRIMSMTAKSSVDSVRMEMIANMVIPVPPPEEQRAIAGAMRDADNLIQALDALVAKKHDLKQAAMQQLFSGKTRLPGFKEAWSERQLREVGIFGKGKGVRKDQVVADGLPCIRYGEIYTQHNDYIRTFFSFISPEVARQSQRLHKGDLLFAGSGETAEEIGKCVAFLGDEEAYAGGDIVILSPSGHDSRFLGYLLNHRTIVEQKARLGQGDAVVHISARNLGDVRVALPKRDEQSAIADVLADMDAEIDVLVSRRDKTKALKQGMMRELLTGRTRIV